MKILVVAPFLPHDRIEHAGGRYLLELSRVLAELGTTTFLAPDVPVAREAVGRDGVPKRHLLVGDPRSAAGVERVLLRVAHRLDRLRSLDASLPPLFLVVGIAASRRVRRLVQEADIIDLQYSEIIWLLPLLRRLNHRAHIACTFHDLLSQRFARQAAMELTHRASRRALRYSRLARRHELAGASGADACVVFSEKDAAILRGHGVRRPVRILLPPLVDDSAADLPALGDVPVVLFVGYLSRPENIDAVEWLLTDIWPVVRRAVPQARLRIIGAGAPAFLSDQIAAAEGAEWLGFVDDLNPIYADSAVAVAPLRLGAGVKFKVVEAMAAGLPVVATPVGAEGIGDESLFFAVANTAPELAAALIEGLTDPTSRTAGEAGRAFVHTAYGRRTFTGRLATAYGLTAGWRPAGSG
jgi:glycosyltransferase involved in cell wall biosynthesis